MTNNGWAAKDPGTAFQPEIRAGAVGWLESDVRVVVMTGDLHPIEKATATPFQRGLLILVGLLVLAAGVLGYIALRNESDYRTIMRDPMRVEADMIDGGPSGRFGYSLRYRFRVENLINTGRIHVSEDDWQWISATKKVPVVYARENPRLFDTNPQVYRDGALKYAWVALAFILLGVIVWFIGPWVAAISISPSREQDIGALAAVLVFLSIGAIQAASAAQNFRAHRALHLDMRETHAEIERTWTVSKGRNGSELVMRYRSKDLVGDFAAPNSTWRKLKAGDRVTAYYSAQNPSISTLEPNSFRRSAFFEAMIALIAFALATPIGLMFWSNRSRRFTATRVSP